MRYRSPILIVAAHPDDEVLGRGGTMARLAAEGHQVFVALLGGGITARFSEENPASQVLLDRLRETAQRVAALLGVKKLYTYTNPDNRFDTVPLLDIIQTVEELIREVEPQVIYTHHAGDLNIDHAITCRAVLTATRPLEGQPVKDIYTFETPSATEWAFGQFSQLFNPNVFMDISDTLDRKIEALACYDSEIRPFPHPRSATLLRALAAQRGSAAGLRAAEAFQLIRSSR